jgi:uroporphyrinogen decarboxylase
MKPQMTHRERILASFAHRETDRVPVDYWGVPEITEKLKKHYNARDMLSLAKAMDIDKIMGVNAPLKPGRANMWNVKMRRIPLPGGAGHYDEAAVFPLREYETIEEIEANYVWPTTDMFDYSTVREQCELYRNEGFAVEGGYISLTNFYDSLRGTEQMLLDFAADEKLTEYILYKTNEFASAHVRRILEEADGLIDVTQVTDDFGAQSGLLMSEAMIERYLGKYYEANCAMAKEFNAWIFHHDDGAIAQIIPWIIGKGCQILNPLQWRLPGWDLGGLKKDYGDALCFHGGIDNQYVLPFGGAEEVKAEVRACVDALYGGNTGYILAPCHNIQAITPMENIFTMYDYAKNYKG